MTRPHASSSAASNRHRDALRSLVAPSSIIACQIRAISQSFSLVEFHESGHRSTPMYVIVRCCHDVAGRGKTAYGRVLMKAWTGTFGTTPKILTVHSQPRRASLTTLQASARTH